MLQETKKVKGRRWGCFHIEELFYFLQLEIFICPLSALTCPKFILNVTHLIVTNEIQSFFFFFLQLAGINVNDSYLEIWTVSFLGASGERAPNFSSFFEVSLECHFLSVVQVAGYSVLMICNHFETNSVCSSFWNINCCHQLPWYEIHSRLFHKNLKSPTRQQPRPPQPQIRMFSCVTGTCLGSLAS